MKIYLAGKIYNGDWRNDIIETRGLEPGEEPVTVHGDVYVGPYFISCDHGCYHGDSTHGLMSDRDCGDVSTMLQEIETRLDFQDIYAGHGGFGDNVKDEVPKLCLSWIDDCDVLFAWIETRDCYGTFAEIGYAHGKGKETWIGYSNKLVMGYSDRPTVFSRDNTGVIGAVNMPIHDTWFIDRLASKVAVSPSAGMLYSRWAIEYKTKKQNK